MWYQICSWFILSSIIYSAWPNKTRQIGSQIIFCNVLEIPRRSYKHESTFCQGIIGQTFHLRSGVLTSFETMSILMGQTKSKIIFHNVDKIFHNIDKIFHNIDQIFHNIEGCDYNNFVSTFGLSFKCQQKLKFKFWC